MSAIASWLRKHWPETAWALFSLANVLVIFSLSEWETVPFHFIWVSLTILYGFRVWGVRTTTVVLSLVMAVTGVALIWSIEHSNQAPDELTEVPLMAAMFVAMVWHARRHQAATEEVRRLAESERRLRERERHFVRNASHELRTPITVARGHAELIRTASEGDEVIKDVEVVLDELKRLSRISERLLIIAAAEHQGFLHLRPVDLGELIATTANRWTATADRAWRLSVLADGTMPADQERLETALDALIENALKFTRDGDVVVIATRVEGDHVLIEVTDQGCGIEPDQVESIFERFTRTPSERHERGGTGLGLAMVKAIVEAHGGTVGVRPDPDRGATFSLRLPGFVSSARPADLLAVSATVATHGPPSVLALDGPEADGHNG
jgi:signal transduction histidine kinase